MNDAIKRTPLVPRVAVAAPNDNYELLLTFNNREKRTFDAHQLLSTAVFSPKEYLI